MKKPATLRISTAFSEIHEALADLREEHERVGREQDARRAMLIDAESKAQSLTIRARAARMARHLQPNESFGPRRPAADGLGDMSPIDERTRRSLEVMGL